MDLLSNNPKARTICVEDLVASFDLFRSFQANSFSCKVSCEFYVIPFALLSLLVSTSAGVCIPSDGILGALGVDHLTRAPSDCILTILCLRCRYDLATV